MSREERIKLLKDLYNEQRLLQMQRHSRSLENSSRIREVRRTIAKILTILNEESKK
ncbi:50S ribosomal protein L29 [Candidatus Bathyarchaeota archaeon ex4484_205]|nr:MAG: 50S ribosomal protein L29 [Candidatus Bathyarchaeota archaeon ex4484_205]RLG67434.1 MAG: 50S ribosomal protein L29 [archaeon]